jgi:hypothetical protein
MPKVTLKNRRVVSYEEPLSGGGWVIGKSRGDSFHLYIRSRKQGGGVFIDYGDGQGLVDAKTEEKTSWFNNRLWTESEEQELIARNREAETSQ